MPIKRRYRKHIQQGIPFYTPLKTSLEENGISSATAGQTAWLIASLLFSVILAIVYNLISLIFDIKIPDRITSHPLFIGEFLFALFIVHFFVVMLRLKYLFVNSIFLAIAYIIFILFGIKDIYLVLAISFLCFVAYLLIPIYSWRIKTLDGFIYFAYMLVGWLCVQGNMS